MDSNSNDNQSKLTKADVKRIAHLAKLEMSEEDAEKFLPQLQQIVDNAKMLEEVDTSNIEPIAQITGIDNMVYADQIETQNLASLLLAQSPQTIEKGMIKVNNIL